MATDFVMHFELELQAYGEEDNLVASRREEEIFSSSVGTPISKYESCKPSRNSPVWETTRFLPFQTFWS